MFFPSPVFKQIHKGLFPSSCSFFSGSNYAGGQWKNWGIKRILSGKAGGLREYLVELLHAEGVKFEGHGQIQEALAAYINAPLLDPVMCLARS